MGRARPCRARARAEETQRRQNAFVPKLRTVEAKRLEGPVSLTLPGQTEPFATARIFARATGYIAERRVDLGARVKQGDVLLRIAAPDLDQQLAQAEANSASSRHSCCERRPWSIRRKPT